jgi:RimJ/RimL family protein N-acetyltransferase
MLKGPRLTLRPVQREDLPKLYEFNVDVEVELLSGGDPPMPRPLAYWQAWYDREATKDRPDSLWFIIEADGQVIGNCGLEAFDRVSRTCELGITIGERGYWSKGYGREAIGLLLDYAFRILNQQRVWLSVNGDNERAIRSYRASGFAEEGRMRRHKWVGGRYIDYVFMGVLREEWERGASSAE